MIFRQMEKCGLSTGIVGLGCEHLEGLDFKKVDSVIKAALACNINTFDVFMPEPEVRSNIGKALEGSRKQVILQGHIGAIFEKGQYRRSRDLVKSRKSFEDFMNRLKTDYVDIGMIHFVDTTEDYKRVFETDIIKYAEKLKRQGTIRAIGLSSHEPSIALKAVKTGLIDVLMFSINPAYDLLPEKTKIDDFFEKNTYEDKTLLGTNNLRAELYQTCESMGVGITVMKSLAAGQLLNKKTSPFNEGLSVHQCMHYALTRPGVKSVLIGCKTAEEVYKSARYLDKTDAEKNYSSILTKTPQYSMTGKCMYCNHCLPCPSRIDIATVTKYLDLAEISDRTSSVVEHYKGLKYDASDCIECGKCEENCPFDVKIIHNMKKAKKMFN